jgi:hypothetical protein
MPAEGCSRSHRVITTHMWQYRVAATLAITGIAGGMYVGDTIALVLLPVAVIMLLAAIASAVIQRAAEDSQDERLPRDPHGLARRPTPPRQPSCAKRSAGRRRIRG